MSHGPTYIPSNGACIYCGAKGVKLTDEHIVPYSLGGAHVLREASCLACADITKKFEQKVARDLWGDARTAFDAPSRRKRDRKKRISMTDPIDPHKKIEIPASEYPAGLVFYKMDRAGLLQGLPETVDISKSWKLVVVDDDKRRTEFLNKYPGKLTLGFRHVPLEFGRLLAKIGYGQILTCLNLEDFRPICLPYILGTKTNVSYVVGGSVEDVQSEPNIGYSMKTAGICSSKTLLLMAIVRLYANTHAPEYHVVVGDVVGIENINRVARKLGWEKPRSTESASLNAKTEHWMPRQL